MDRGLRNRRVLSRATEGGTKPTPLRVVIKTTAPGAVGNLAVFQLNGRIEVPGNSSLELQAISLKGWKDASVEARTFRVVTTDHFQPTKFLDKMNGALESLELDDAPITQEDVVA